MAALDITGIYAAIESHALASGWFDRVAGHEPKNAPGHGFSLALWLDEIAPDPESSGLSSTSGRVTLNARIYTSMLADDQDAIDPTLAGATHDLMGRLSGDFTLGGRVRNIDLLGQSSNGRLSAKAGYLNQDGKLFRVMVITIPVLINDLWEQGE